MSCHCIGDLVTSIKGIFTRKSTAEKATKSGELSGRSVTQQELTPEQQKVNEAAQVALKKILEGEDPGPMDEETRKKVEEGLKGVYVMVLAQQVAESDAKNFEEAEKAAQVALEKFTKDFVDNLTAGQKEEIPANVKEQISKEFEKSLGVAPKDLAVLGMILREQMKANAEQPEEAQAAEQTQQPVAPAA